MWSVTHLFCRIFTLMQTVSAPNYTLSWVISEMPKHALIFPSGHTSEVTTDVFFLATHITRDHTFLWHVLSCLAPPLCPPDHPSPLSMLRPPPLVYCPVQYKAVSPSASVSLLATRFRFAPVLSLFSASLTRSLLICLFPLRPLWITRPWWRRDVFEKRRPPSWF